MKGVENSIVVIEPVKGVVARVLRWWRNRNTLYIGLYTTKKKMRKGMKRK